MLSIAPKWVCNTDYYAFAVYPICAAVRHRVTPVYPSEPGSQYLRLKGHALCLVPQVDDLEIRLEDKSGFPASIGPKGARLVVTPRDSLPGGVGSPRGGGGKKNAAAAAAAAAAKRDLSKKATHAPELKMPKFSLDLKLQGESQHSPVGATAGGGSSASAKAVGKAEKERAARIAREGVALVVRAEASGIKVEEVSLPVCCLCQRVRV